MVDGCGCPDVVAWVERSRSERTSGEVRRRGKGLKEWQGEASHSTDRFPTSPTSSAFLSPFILVPRVFALPADLQLRFFFLPSPRNNSLDHKSSRLPIFFCMDVKEILRYCVSNYTRLISKVVRFPWEGSCWAQAAVADLL